MINATKIFLYDYSRDEKRRLIRTLVNIEKIKEDYEVIIKPSSLDSGRKTVSSRERKSLKEVIEETELKFMIENKTLSIRAYYGVLLHLVGDENYLLIPKEYWGKFTRNPREAIEI